MRLSNLIMVGSLVLAPALAAEELQIQLDPERTSVGFRFKATLHTVHGSVAAVAGSTRLNTDDGLMAGEVVVDATTAETGINKRDKKMHAKVLRTSDYPRIVLITNRLEGELVQDGTSDVTLYGAMELLGQNHDISIPLHIEINGERFNAVGEFEVPYVEWGLDDPSTFVLWVAKVVQVTVEASGTIVGTD